MVNWVLQKLFGTYHERECKRLWPLVAQVNRFEPQIQKLTDAQLRAKTDEFRARLAQAMTGHEFVTPASPQWYELNHDQRQELRRQRRAIQQRALDSLLPEVFAVVRETAKRTVNMRHFDVQLLGGMVLHEGKIAEMATGEGKTLVATLAAYLNALTGRGVHIVTVNDYLARRDARWMGPIYHALGLSIGVIQGVDPAERRTEESLSFRYDPTWTQTSERFVHLRPVTRREAYAADITYGQNNEFGFDYLRDNMRFRQDDLTQGEYHYAIVDEVDSILIDEARTPLIISGPAEESTELYYRLDQIVRRLDRAQHYEVEEKEHAVTLTEAGIARCEELLGLQNLYEESHMRLIHHINQALRAHELYKRDVDYMIKDDEIIIVDEFTGRLMPGRRWSDGLHQAIEAKEGVKIRQENQTLASVTFQNYFRMYEKLAGMTGTASTEAQEFSTIYKLDVVAAPTNRPLSRINFADTVYKTVEEKFVAVVQEIVERYRLGQPMLIGTISIEKSEHLSRMLKEPGPILKRLGTVCQWVANEVQKEPVSQELRARIEQLCARPANATEAQAAELLEQIKRDAPKSVLVFRFGDILRLVQTMTTIRQGLPHNVLNAKYHEHEARIVAQAGRKGAITIATNMAGRGTDILLGGNPQSLADDVIREEETKRQAPLSDAERAEIIERFKRSSEEEHNQVVALGGLHVLGTERHEARRIDNQLRGRSGRQGDPGSARFYLSFEDDLMRVFGSDRIGKLMELKWFQWEEGLPIEHGMVTRAIETAQRRVEGHNFDIRKQLLEYDNTMNRQREVIYEQRRRILEGVDLQGLVRTIMAEIADGLVETFAAKELRPDAWDLAGLREAANRQFGVAVPEEAVAGDREQIAGKFEELLQQAYEAKRQAIGEVMPQLERTILLSIMDAKWKDHLFMMDSLREGIHLRGYGQRDPLVEYQREAYRMFQDMIESIKIESLTMLLRVQPAPTGAPTPATSVFARTPVKEMHPDASQAERFIPTAQPVEEPPAPRAPVPSSSRKAAQIPAPVQHAGPKVGRNDPCHCGSGKKFKKCHGA
ncbi:MAG: preprotein translocase subunit SecA [Candidatus Omnitrophica bacterium CG11_big_fil_rev_8_21_14_0_20_63_9]|nr:MAG: preprotein translocase subunit SecA [Candidatus Omnitrophica bacterium CG11_big_fil_rev_8_21_14_0_20_63_9]